VLPKNNGAGHMLKIWGLVKKDNKIIKNTTAKCEDYFGFDTALHQCIVEICHTLDLAKPIFLNKHMEEMTRFNRTVFYAEDFTEKIDFDTFEIERINLKKPR